MLERRMMRIFWILTGLLMFFGTGGVMAQGEGCCRGINPSPTSIYKFRKNNPTVPTGAYYEEVHIFGAPYPGGNPVIKVYSGGQEYLVFNGEIPCASCDMDLRAYNFLDQTGNGVLDGEDYSTEQDLLKAFFQKTLFRDIQNDKVEIEVKRAEVWCDDCAWGFLTNATSPLALSEKASDSEVGMRCFGDAPSPCELETCPGYPRDASLQYDCCGSYGSKILRNEESKTNHHLLLTTGRLVDLTAIGIGGTSTVTMSQDMADQRNYQDAYSLMNLVRDPRHPYPNADDNCMIDLVFKVKYRDDVYAPPAYEHHLQLPYLFGTEETIDSDGESIDDRFGIFCRYLGEGEPSGPLFVNGYKYTDIYTAIPDQDEVFDFSLARPILEPYLSDMSGVEKECVNYENMSKYLSLCRNQPGVSGRKDARGIRLEQGFYRMSFVIGERDNNISADPSTKDIKDSGLMIGEAYVCSSLQSSDVVCMETSEHIEVVEPTIDCSEKLSFQLSVNNTCTLSDPVIQYQDWLGAELTVEADPAIPVSVSGRDLYTYELNLPGLAKKVDHKVVVKVAYTCGSTDYCYTFWHPSSFSSCYLVLEAKSDSCSGHLQLKADAMLSEGNSLFATAYCPTYVPSECTVRWLKWVSGSWVEVEDNGLTYVDASPGVSPVQYRVDLVCPYPGVSEACTTSYRLNAEAPSGGLPTPRIVVQPKRCDPKSSLTVYAPETADRTVLSYLWSNLATGPTVEEVDPGTYTVTIQYSGGLSCTTTATVVVSSNVLTLPELPDTLMIGCSDECTEYNLAAALDWDTTPITGGNPRYAIHWSTGAEFYSDESGTFPAVPVPAISKPGVYYYTVMDFQGCEQVSNGMRVIFESGVSYQDCINCNTCDD